MNVVTTTARLAIRQFDYSDAEFVMRLVNTPGWLEFIGDRNVRSLEDARNYLTNGPMRSYSLYGFGLSLVSLKEGGIPIGMCGFLKRDNLEHVDIGFAFLPEFSGHGYATEAVKAMLEGEADRRVLAITSTHNFGSIGVLLKNGIHFDRVIDFQNEKLLLFNNVIRRTDKSDIDLLTGQFFSAFTNKGGMAPRVKMLEKLFIEKGMIIRNLYGIPEIYDLHEFIGPRQVLLTNGTLTDFEEEETDEQTRISGHIAQRFSTYKKSGILNGELFETHGVKSIQFIRIGHLWKIASVTWDDFSI